MKFSFTNKVFIETDRVGAHYVDETVAVGFSNSGEKGKRIYSFDELESLRVSGELDDPNVGYRESDGQFYLHESYCVFNGIGHVQCGQVIGKSLEPEMMAYAKRIGLVSDDFIPVPCWFGIKTMSRNEDGSYNIYYQVKNPLTNTQKDAVSQLMIGAVKKLAGKREVWTKEGQREERKVFECQTVSFDFAADQLKIEGIPVEYVNGLIMHQLKQLDLELWMLCEHGNVNWHRFFNVSVQMVMDKGQTHWLESAWKRATSQKDSASQLNWANRVLGEKWELD